MRTRNTIRVSPASESSRPGASGQVNTPSSMYDSTMVVSEKNTLFLPQELKLGGPSNWEQYSPAQKAILRINGLEDAVFGDYPPEEQQTMDQKIRAAKAAVSIRGNCTGEALSQLVGIENPQEMYNLLQAYCIGTGPVLLQTTLYQFIRIKTSSYETIPQFNVDFERLVKLLLEQKEPISDTLKKVVYLTACENEYPDWTARQRALLRSEHPPTLRSMQQDLIDENRSSDDDDSHGTASTAIDGLTPMESFLNEALPGQDNKPDLSGERICGSQVTIHIPQERRLRSHKFGPRGEAGIYLCMEGSQIYTCWVPSRRKGHQIVRSANVQFYEKVRETELLTETEHDVEPEIRKNGAPISSRPQSVTEQTKTPSPQSMDRRQHP
ncbi:hypothetical protein FOFC_07952 [Fusarium oxysporum]|nr:hypothetical protein FOFC_17811 [Fusarium oxysporum]KAI8411358.1 hypothetical protein FOFC_07952 [Fusarium oxysporum]